MGPHMKAVSCSSSHKVWCTEKERKSHRCSILCIPLQITEAEAAQSEADALSVLAYVAAHSLSDFHQQASEGELTPQLQIEADRLAGEAQRATQKFSEADRLGADADPCRAAQKQSDGDQQTWDAQWASERQVDADDIPRAYWVARKKYEADENAAEADRVAACTCKST